jgi:hypothetical protein
MHKKAVSYSSAVVIIASRASDGWTGILESGQLMLLESTQVINVGITQKTVLSGCVSHISQIEITM